MKEGGGGERKELDTRAGVFYTSQMYSRRKIEAENGLLKAQNTG